MFIFDFLDKRFTIKGQTRFMFTYGLVGLPIGFLVGEIIDYSYNLETYTFNFGFLFYFSLLLIILIYIPIGLNYYRHNRRFKKFVAYVEDFDSRNHGGDIYVKALYDYKDYKKGELLRVIYTITSPYFILLDSPKDIYILRHVFNHFELVDLKNDRRRKLKKLKKVK